MDGFAFYSSDFLKVEISFTGYELIGFVLNKKKEFCIHKEMFLHDLRKIHTVTRSTNWMSQMFYPFFKTKKIRKNRNSGLEYLTTPSLCHLY